MEVMSSMESRSTLEAYSSGEEPRLLEGYQLVKTLGSGAYGAVYTAIDLNTGETVVVKRVKYNINIHREIDILSSCHHPNIISFKDSIIDCYLGNVFVVMEHAGTNMKTYLNNNKHERLKEPTVRGLMFQLLLGVAYLHSRKMVHSDLKPDNLFLKDQRQLKICDFGLSKRLEVLQDDECDHDKLSQVVISRWYCSPELLLGVEKFTTGIDVWSVGCIMAEMVMNKVLFPGLSDIDQLNRIFLVMGSSDLETWPGLDELKMGRVVLRGRRRYNRLRSIVPARVLSDEGFDLLNKLLEINPARRISAMDALAHAWFRDLLCM